MAFKFDLRKKITSLVALGACLLAGAAAAQAQTVCVSQGQTKTFTYKQRPSLPGAATATFKLEHDVLTVEYKNIAATAFLTGVGFDAELALESDTATTASEGWSAGPGNGGGLGNYDFVVHGNGGDFRLAPGLGGKATFTLDYARSEVCIRKTVAHLTGLAGGTSKPVGVLTGEGRINPDVPHYVD